ncbi:MAG TPA: hypothetical protein VGA67_05805 [Candidatus Dojkabacteria bacterium]|jgi:hypothetical protein
MKKYIVMVFSTLVFCFALSGVIILNLQRLDKLKLENNNSNSEKTNPPVEINLPLKGVSISPKSFSLDDYQIFYEKASEGGDALTWAGNWDELEDRNSAAYSSFDLALENNLTPITLVGQFEHASKSLYRPATQETFDYYEKITTGFLEEKKPPYFGIGVEINSLYNSNPQDYDKSIKFYKYLYTKIKEISPATKVFTVFQLERMKGLNGGLFGGKNDASQNQWHLISEIEEYSDLIGFTTYPCLIYQNPSEIPSDYYSEILEHTSKPIAFFEIGWFRESRIPGWESDKEEQGDFINKFYTLNKLVKPEIVIWPFLYDQLEAPVPFKNMGLIGEDEKSFELWQNLNFKYSE